jgi:Zincin-like metallopeptidase
LRAELASVFLAAERGIPPDPEQHAAYVSSWIDVLKQDKNEIFRAAHDASRAADFLLALERDRSIAREVLPAKLTLDSTELGDLPAVVLAHETKNRELVPGDGRLGPAPSADSAEKTPNRKTLGRARTTGRGR